MFVVFLRVDGVWLLFYRRLRLRLRLRLRGSGRRDTPFVTVLGLVGGRRAQAKAQAKG